MKNDFPDIEAATMIFRTRFSNDEVGVTVYQADKNLRSHLIPLADADFFNVFDYPFVEGDPNTALSEPKKSGNKQKKPPTIFLETIRL